jgi:hypothetical protein
MINREDLEDVRKSSHSPQSGDCVEAGRTKHGTVGVGDSHHQDRPYLEFSKAEWSRFLSWARSGG